MLKLQLNVDEGKVEIVDTKNKKPAKKTSLKQLRAELEDAKSKAQYWNGQYMYEECADRGYDHNASKHAQEEQSKYEAKVKELEAKIAKQVEANKRMNEKRKLQNVSKYQPRVPSEWQKQMKELLLNNTFFTNNAVQFLLNEALKNIQKDPSKPTLDELDEKLEPSRKEDLKNEIADVVEMKIHTDLSDIQKQYEEAQYKAVQTINARFKQDFPTTKDQSDNKDLLSVELNNELFRAYLMNNVDALNTLGNLHDKSIKARKRNNKKPIIKCIKSLGVAPFGYEYERDEENKFSCKTKIYFSNERWEDGYDYNIYMLEITLTDITISQIQGVTKSGFMLNILDTLTRPVEKEVAPKVEKDKVIEAINLDKKFIEKQMKEVDDFFDKDKIKEMVELGKELSKKEVSRIMVDVKKPKKVLVVRRFNITKGLPEKLKRIIRVKMKTKNPEKNMNKLLHKLDMLVYVSGSKTFTIETFKDDKIISCKFRITDSDIVLRNVDISKATVVKVKRKTVAYTYNNNKNFYVIVKTKDELNSKELQLTKKDKVWLVKERGIRQSTRTDSSKMADAVVEYCANN